MAYITKEQVQAKQQKLKFLNKEYGVTARFSGSNSSTLKLKITASKIDFIENFCIKFKNNTDFYGTENQKQELINRISKEKHIQVNHYYLDTYFSGIALEYLQKAYNIMLGGYYDRSDIMTDYFDCSWYNSIDIGSWDKPFIHA